MGPDKTGDGGVIREDADDTGAAFDLFVDALQQAGASHLAPVGQKEVVERLYGLLG